MELTEEQIAIVNSTGNIKINAVAGSGKTTTIIEYAKAKPRTSKILYLAFNKSVKIEARRRFKELEIHNVTVETAHSIAFKNIVYQNHYRLKSKDYRTNEIVELLQLEGNGERYAEYIIANHINKFLTYFCNSDKRKVEELNYLNTVSDKKAKTFVSNLYKYIEKKTRELLNKMDKGEIEISHDFYLKKFQLSNPKLNYDYILFDEGQDASSAMLDIFLKQEATKIIVGDAHQQIYGWRYAINSLEKTDFIAYNLTRSFRFNQNIANLAKSVLGWKKFIKEDNSTPFQITGLGKSDKIKSKAVLARTNLGLLLKAIEYVTEKKTTKNIYFEGNINSYAYANEGTSLYDVLNLYNGKHYRIKDKLIRQMRNLEDLEDYVNKTEDVQIGMMIEIVKEYGNKIPSIIKKIKEKHIDNDDKKNAEMIFSTVHRSKGMEYDIVQIVNDFISEDDLEKRKESSIGTFNSEGINEEINLLYVAITRTKNSLYIPENIIPKNFPKFPNIHIIKNTQKGIQERETEISYSEYTEIKENNKSNEKTYSFEEIRKTHREAYKPWSEEMDNELTVMYCEGINIRDLAKHFGRTKGAIRSRIKKLELKEIYG